MNKLYGKLAITNIKKNKLLYVPYIISGIIVIAFVYIMYFMKLNRGIDSIYHADMVRQIMNFGLWIVLIFSYIFLFYTNSFLLKKRKKEFGVYNMLGMEKRHVCRVIAVESLIVALVSIAGGLLAGIMFSKLCMLLYLHIINVDVSFAFEISLAGVGYTIIGFGILYLLILIHNCIQIRRADTMELIRGSSVGEREPGAKVILSVIGFICLGAGYYLSITITDPYSAVLWFFVAVILVIIGTYLMFTTGSIFVLKLLKRNKKFYYNRRHMTAVSGMLYRMKQNAVGLANICILSTMVLVTISTTVSMYAGVEENIITMYPAEMEIDAYSAQSPLMKNEEALSFISDKAKEYNLTVDGSMMYSSFVVTGELKNGRIEAEIGNDEDYISFMTRADFIKTCPDYTGKVPKLASDEVFIVCPSGKYDKSYLEFCKTKYKVKKAGAFDETFVVVADDTVLDNAYKEYTSDWTSWKNSFSVKYLVECSGSQEAKMNFADNIMSEFEKTDSRELFGQYDRLNHRSREDARMDYYYSYGGLLFLGIVCGLMFLVVTIMIIFYKQISEGYDDRERYAIMEKVGMSQPEVKSTISSQIKIVFFLPLIVSCCHLAGAFPMIKLMVSTLFMTDVKILAISLVITAVIFAMIYYLIFKLTSKAYYDIVK